MKRIEEEVLLLRRTHPSAVLSPAGDWVEVPDYALPPGVYNVEVTRVRVPVTPGYPDTAPDNFYVPSGLRLRSGAGLDNYSELPKFEGTWGQFSWHPRSWRAAARPEKGDNLGTFFNTIRKRLEEGK